MNNNEAINSQIGSFSTDRITALKHNNNKKTHEEKKSEKIMRSNCVYKQKGSKIDTIKLKDIYVNSV